MKSGLKKVVVASVILFTKNALAQTDLGPISPINSFETPAELAVISRGSNPVSFTQVKGYATEGVNALRVDFPASNFPGFVFDFSQQPRDWSSFGGLAFDVYNPTPYSVKLWVALSDGRPHSDSLVCAAGASVGAGIQLPIYVAGLDKLPVRASTYSVTIPPMSGGTTLLPFQDFPSPLSMGMQVLPPVVGYFVMQRGQSLDSTHITSLRFYLDRPQTAQTLIFDNMRLFGAKADSLISYTGIVDKYGQFSKTDWPGKVKNGADLKRQMEIENNAAFPDRRGLDTYGGIMTPALNGTGFFRTARDDAGRWWLVTPAGHRFFSVGIDLVSASSPNNASFVGQTDVEGREQMFSDLPTVGSPLARFYTPPVYTPQGGWNLSPNVKFTLGRGFNFYYANLWQKYGENYQDAWAKSTIDRFTGWGINTFARDSDRAAYSAAGSLGQRIPHTGAIFYSGNFASIVTPYDFGPHMVDPFDPSFIQAVNAAAATQVTSTDDSLIGYFVDNELRSKNAPARRIRGFHHSGPEIPGSARDGKPRSFFLCFLVIFMASRLDLIADGVFFLFICG